MTQAPKSLNCLLCLENVHFTYTENEPYLDHLKLEHRIEYYRHLTLMINLMDKTYVDFYSNLNTVSKHKTLVCLLCRKEKDFSGEEGDQYSSHLKNEHMIIANFQLVRSVNLMDNDGLRGIINKFEETYEVDDEVNSEDSKSNDYMQTNINSNDDTTNLGKKSKNEEEKMLIEDGSRFDDSMTTVQRDQEEMFGELEEELLNASEAKNYYKSNSVNADGVDQDDIKSQSETLPNHSEYANVSFPNDSMDLMDSSASSSFQSSASLNSSSQSNASLNSSSQSYASLNSSFQSNASLNSSFQPNASLNSSFQSNTSLNSSFQSNASLNSPSNVSPKKELGSRIKLEDSNNLSQSSNSTANKNPVTKMKKEVGSENSNFSEAVQNEIEKGNLSTTMDITHEKTIKKMKELTAMFMNGTTCVVCDRGFNTKSHLHEHIESLHNPLPVYFCQVCQLPMTSSARHRQHKRKCSG